MTGQERTVSHSVQHPFWSRVVVYNRLFFLDQKRSFVWIKLPLLFFRNNLFLDRKLEYKFQKQTRLKGQ